MFSDVDQNTTSGRSGRAGGGKPAKLADAIENRPHLEGEREFHSENQFAIRKTMPTLRMPQQITHKFAVRAALWLGF